MSYNDKKFLDQDGLVTLLKKLDNYPTNEILGTVVNAIQMSLGGKVGDVQVNGNSIVDGGIANIPIATHETAGLVKINGNGLTIVNDIVRVVPASNSAIQTASNTTGPIVPGKQHLSVFYGLAKAAGYDEKNSSLTFGTYTNAAKNAIQNMLGITDLLSTEESSTATAAHALNSTFMMDGKLYKATAAIAIGEAVVEGQNCEVVKADEVFVKNTDIATDTTFGVVKIKASEGISIYENGIIFVNMANSNELKNGISYTKPVVPRNQHTAIFFGLSKLAGVDLASETVTIGTYPETSKTAIRSLIGAAAVSDIPSVPVQDVQVNGTSVLSSGIANVPIMSASTAGVAKVTSYYGLDIITSGNSVNTIRIYSAADTDVKAGTNAYKPIVPNHQHESVFYGLTKAAGVDMSSSSNAVGTYTESAKTAIRSMIGATSSNVIAVQDTQPVEADAKIWMMETAPGSVQVPTMEDLAGYVQKTDIATSSTCGIIKTNANFGTAMRDSPYQDTLMVAPAGEQNVKEGVQGYQPIVPSRQHISVYYGLSKLAGVDLANETVTVGTYPETSKTAIRTMIGAISNTDYATSSVAGVVKVNTNYGVQMTRVDSSSPYEILATQMASAAELKAGTNYYKPAVPANIHQATFYGLAKAAGDTTMASSSNAVGTYTTEAKAAIHTMLGIDPASIAAQVDIPLVETVSGTTPTITGQPNVRYVCGEVSTISITPPASGSVDVIFESGSTATVMTVPSTVKWPAWFDAETLETNTTYEILITDGIYGSVMTWAT